MKKKQAPITAETPAGAVITTAEAMESRIPNQQKVGESLADVCLWFDYYNFVRIHQAPGMAAGVNDRVWELREVASSL